MNKVLIIAMLSLMSPQVMAAWTRLEGAPDTGVNVYANVGKVRSTGASTVKMQYLLDFQSKQKTISGIMYSSKKVLGEYDCDEESFRVLVSSLYTGQMGSGKVVKLTGNASPWLPVEPNSLAVVLWKTACGKQTIERHL